MTYEADELPVCSDASNMRSTGNRCRFGSPKIVEPLGLCARSFRSVRLAGKVPRRARWAILSVLDHKARTTTDLAQRAGLRRDTARRILAGLTIEGIVARILPGQNRSNRWLLQRKP